MSRGRSFSHECRAKAEEAGRQVVKVSPAYTSQTCSGCLHRQTMPLSVRIYECPQCGLVIHRDHNGSLNIIAEAFQAVGRHSRVIPEAPACSRGESSLNGCPP
jgi:putative transposase